MTRSMNMELTIERDSFIKSLSKLQGIVEKRNAMPILSNTLLRASEQSLELVATDLEVTVMDSCPVDLKLEGDLTLNAKKLHDIVRELPEGPVSLKTEKDFHVEVKSGKIRFELLGMSSDDYPKVPDPGSFKFIDISGPVFLDMIQKTIYAVAGEEARFSLNGILAQKTEDGKRLMMVATDGHRLAKVEREIEKIDDFMVPDGMILPRKGMAEAVKVLEGVEGNVGFAVQEKMAALKVEDTVLIMRLVDGKFPDYKRVIIEGCDKFATVKNDELIRNLRRVSIMVDEKARAVRFSFKNGVLELESKNPNFGSSHSELDIEYGGEQVDIGFNDKYFIDIMNAGKGDEIVIELLDDKSPAIVKGKDDDGYICVVMPMRL
jgi:DNA polymerase III subunit beta